MNLQLEDKTALVTSASKGIGKGVATALAKEGCAVIITSSNQENLKAAQAEIAEACGREPAAHVLDATERRAVADAMGTIVTAHPRIDILFANSPGPKPMAAMDMEMADLDWALQTNLTSFVQLAQAVLPGMIERGFGRIINLTSTTALEPDEGMVLSNLARAGVAAFAKTLSREVAKHGVTVNTILTGGVMTDRAVSLINADLPNSGKSFEEYVEDLGKSIPVGFIASPEQFAQAIAFLASPLSAYVNGISLPLDGGYMRSL